MLFVIIILGLLSVSFVISFIFSNLGIIFFTILFDLLLIISATFYLIRDKIIYWPVVLALCFLIAGLNIFCLVLSNILAKFAFLFFSLGLTGALLSSVYNLSFRPRLWDVKGFRKIGYPLTFLTSFYFFTAVGALNFFLKISLVKLGIILFPLLCWLSFYNLWFKKPRPNFFLIFVFALLGLECCLALEFLPLGFYLNSFLSSLFFSLMFFPQISGLTDFENEINFA